MCAGSAPCRRCGRRGGTIGRAPARGRPPPPGPGKTARGAARAPRAAAEADKSGSLVIEADRIAKSYAERPIVSDFTTRIRRGDRLGIVGPNGTGKTTLIHLLTGALAPDGGTVRLGANLVTTTLGQGR